MGEKTSLRERIRNDQEIKKHWEHLKQEDQQALLEIDAGVRIPNFLSDAIFKRIFDPDEYGERLSRFVSAVLGKKVRVLHSLKNEGRHHSIYSKGIILDMVVQFEDGSIGNVEIQRYGLSFPSKRGACYSADLVTRQYAAIREEEKSEIDYNLIEPVYTIVIFEKSPADFAKNNQYHHHFEQRSDTGVELELLQYYDYVCLDTFKKKKPHIAGELEKWMDFLTISDMDRMQEFLKKEPSFQDVYHCATMMTKDRKELMELMSDFFSRENIVGSLNLTNESTIKQLRGEIEEKDSVIEEQASELQVTYSKLEEKDKIIEELRRQLGKGAEQ